jgi:chemotaxis protein methyltransferase CheR
VRDTDCVVFLQWALPKLGMRWAGFRKVRRQVCKRIMLRLKKLGLRDIFAYQAHLGTHAEEWSHVDELCRISISRFYRDQKVFEYLTQNGLPLLATMARYRDPAVIRAWSAGCGAGEEPYTLSLLWRFSLQGSFPEVRLEILATDLDRRQLERAQAGCYEFASIKELPGTWIVSGFEHKEGRCWLRPEFRAGIEFRNQDIRRELPDGPFDLLFCRNLVFTYFEESLQDEIARGLHKRLVPGGLLALGSHESIPLNVARFHQLQRGLPLYQTDLLG